MKTFAFMRSIWVFCKVEHVYYIVVICLKKFQQLLLANR